MLTLAGACAKGEEAADSAAAAAGDTLAAPRLMAAGAGQPTCPGGVPTQAPGFAVTFADAPVAQQRAYLGNLSFVPALPSADSVRVPSAPGAADSVTLRFEPEACSNYVVRGPDLEQRGRVVGRLLLLDGSSYASLGIRTPADTVYWWVGPDTGKAGIRSYFVRAGDATRYWSRELILGNRPKRPAPQGFAQVKLFHDDAHQGPRQTGATGAMMHDERRVAANKWARTLSLQAGDSPEPWFSCAVDCCVSNTQ